MRLLRLKTPDNAVKTVYVDEGRTVEQLMEDICHRLRITSNHEFSLAREGEVLESSTGTMRSSKAKAMKEIRKNLRTEETGKILYKFISFKNIYHSPSVDWLDENRTLREQNILESETLLMMTKVWNLDDTVDKK